MWRFSKLSLFSFRLSLLLICSMLALQFIYYPVAHAQSGNSVTITAVVAPVRTILVDNNLRIIQIESNTPLNVTPSVYKGTYTSKQVSLTPSINKQYKAIINRVNTRKTGIIYSYNPRFTSPTVINHSILKKLIETNFSNRFLYSRS